MSDEAKSPIPLTKSKNSRRHQCRSRHGLEAVGRLILKVPRYFLPDLASVNAERSGTSRTGPLSAKKEHAGRDDPCRHRYDRARRLDSLPVRRSSDHQRGEDGVGRAAYEPRKDADYYIDKTI